MAGGRGGARPGAGRPRLRLVELVERRRFHPFNPRHRRALLEDDLPDSLTPLQRQLAEAYRHGAGAPAASWVARRFAVAVEDPDRERRAEAHVERLREQARQARDRADRPHTRSLRG